MAAPTPAPTLEPAPLTPEEVARLSVAQLGARVIVEQLERVLRHEPGTRAGEDPEDLHKMRVATRRLRVAFRVFGDALAREGIYPLPDAEVKEVARALGGVRDLDVFGEWLHNQAEALGDGSGAIERLREERMRRRDAARAEMLRVLDGPAMAVLGGELRDRLREIGEPDFLLPGAGIKKKRRVKCAGKDLAHKALRRLRRRADVGTGATSDELHEIRIAAKRFRYVCEFIKPAFGQAVEGAIEVTTAVQDALGEVHDADVAEESLLADVERVAAGERCADAGAIARLVAHQRRRREEALLAFRRAWDQLPPAKWLKHVDVEELSDDRKRSREESDGLEATGDSADHVLDAGHASLAGRSGASRGPRKPRRKK
jgi:CHAD domain-containing protein